MKKGVWMLVEGGDENNSEGSPTHRWWDQVKANMEKIGAAEDQDGTGFVAAAK